MAEQTYSLVEEAVRNSIVFNCRYRVNESGVTMDWTVATAKLRAKLTGDITYTVEVIPNSDEPLLFAFYLDGKLLKKDIPVDLTGTETKDYEIIVSVCDKKGEHVCELCRETQVGHAVTLKSVAFDGELLAEKQSDTLVEIVGDSMTSMFDGIGSYANLTVRALGKDYRVVSKGGSGLMHSASGGTSVGKAWINTYGIECYGRSMSAPYVCGRKADVVCIFLGTNDYHARNQGWAHYSEEQLRSYITQMTALVRSYQTKAKIVWITGGMTYAIRDAITTVTQKLGGKEKGYFVFAFGGGYHDGEMGHPSAAQHVIMADELNAFLTSNGLVK